MAGWEIHWGDCCVSLNWWPDWPGCVLRRSNWSKCVWMCQIPMAGWLMHWLLSQQAIQLIHVCGCAKFQWLADSNTLIWLFSEQVIQLIWAYVDVLSSKGWPSSGHPTDPSMCGCAEFQQLVKSGDTLTWLLSKQVIQLIHACVHVLSFNDWLSLIHWHDCCLNRQSDWSRCVWTCWVSTTDWV